MAEAPAVFALRVPVRGVGSFDRARAGEESDGRAHRLDIPGVDGDNDRGSGLALSTAGVRVKESSGKDANVLRIEDRLRQARERFVGVFREEGEGKGVDGELGLVGGEAEGQPGSVSH